MKKTNSLVPILAALIGNTLIAITKFFAAFLTNSAAMFSEAIHSVVDVGNQALLLVGVRLSHRQPDKAHPFGYGKEIYFWSLVVAILLFALGGGMSLYKGIIHWRHPAVIEHVIINYLVLGSAMVFEAVAWFIAYRALRKGDNSRHLIRSIQRSKDPALMVVLLEDTAALTGLMIAMGGIYLSSIGYPKGDPLASILIGLLLVVVAVWLAYESKNLLIGESANPEVVAKIREIVRLDPHIKEAKQILTMHMGPDELIVNLYVDFHDDISSQDIERAITNLEAKIKAKVSIAQWIFIAAKSFRRQN